jgi:hypothetical protein
MYVSTKDISEIRKIREKSLCCPDTEIVKTRVVFNSEGFAPNNIMRGYGASRQEVVSFKALIKRGGRGREFEVKRVGVVSANSPVLQGIQAVGSVATPGNLSVIRSPIRSTIARALTPGVPGGLRRGMGAGDGVSRCPEGYQYGGRFTDNRFSTCGQKLFQIPGPLGAAIGAIRRLARLASPQVPETGSEVLGAGQQGDNLVQARAPQIPKVSLSNPQKLRIEVEKLVKPLGAIDLPTVRMVRRDGYILEPVVPASVLRTIPDNRDMEGATYLLNVSNPADIGRDELGLLSNTGITSLKYVLPGGSVLTLEKRRPLTVGERRKLGRTVNAAIESDNSNDPASRLKMVANETGEGIGYSESFVAIARPNEIGKDGKQRWATLAFRKRKTTAAPKEDVAERTPESSAPIGKNISTLEGAIAHVNRGGALSQISPTILQQVLARMNEIKRDKVSASQTMLTMPNKDKYMLKTPKSKYEALSQRFASDLQQHLGIESANVLFVGEGDSRSYLFEDAETALKGGKVNDDARFGQAPWADVMRLMFADILTDVPNRNSGSINLVEYDGKMRVVPSGNDGAGLVNLSKISIRERTEAQLRDLLNPSESELYIEYFRQLKAAQRAQYLQFIATLIQRARAFNFSNFKARLYNDGKLSSGEKIHLNILEKLFTQRLDILTRQNDVIREILAGKQ